MSRAHLLRSALVVILSLSLTACGAGTRDAGVLAAVRVPHKVARVSVPYTIYVTVPATVKAGSIALALTPKAGGSTVKAVAGLAAFTAVKLSLPATSYGVQLTTYSGPLKNGQPSGHVLAVNRRIPVRVTGGGSSKFALGGVPKSVLFVPSSALVFNAPTGTYLSSKCFPSQTASVFALDAGGNTNGD